MAVSKCGSCTLCCDLLKIPEVDSDYGELCKHCDLNKGCKIYEDRPEACREFECCWLQMETVGIELRPDKCGVIFEKWADDIILATTRKGPTPLVVGQIKSFMRENISVVMLDQRLKKKTYYLAEGHTKEYVENKINGSSVVH